MKPIFLIRGLDWDDRSAGTRALHLLCEELRKRGEDAYLGECKLAEGSTAQVVKDDDLKEILVQDRLKVVIEPEVFGDEIPWADLVVRWLLNAPGKAGLDMSWKWKESDLLCHWDGLFAMKGSIPLCVPGTVDTKLFNNENNQRDKERNSDCFYSRKLSHSKVHVEFPEWALDISNLKLSRKDMAELFRRTHHFYTGEATACTIEAALCGAQVHVIANAYFPNPPDIDDYANWYLDLEKRAVGEIDRFVDSCYSRLGLLQAA